MDYYWLFWAAIFLAGAFFIWRLNIFVGAFYLKKPDNHLLSLSVTLFKRLKLYTWHISPPDFFQDCAASQKLADGEKGDEPAEKRQGPSRDRDDFNLYRQLLGKLLTSLYFEKFRLRLVYGFEDAALTGMSSGVLSALRGVFLAICGTHFKMKETPDISFSPTFGTDRLEVDFNCIFSIRLGNVIAIAVNALISFCANTAKWPNFTQGGETKWRNILFKT